MFISRSLRVITTCIRKWLDAYEHVCLSMEQQDYDTFISKASLVLSLAILIALIIY